MSSKQGGRNIKKREDVLLTSIVILLGLGLLTSCSRKSGFYSLPFKDNAFVFSSPLNPLHVLLSLVWHLPTKPL